MLREETVEPVTLGLLKRMTAIPALAQFRLAGGTALSLMYGHRKSIDLDFFTDQPFDKEGLIEALEDNFGRIIPLNDRSKSIYQCSIQDVKVDFVSVKDPFLYPPNIVDQIPLTEIRDLIALKLNGIKGRGAKKDFWDIATLLNHYSFEQLFQYYTDRYPWDDSMAVNRSVGYFEDAEDDQDPIALDGITWGKVKKTIKKALQDYYKHKKDIH